MQKTPSRTGRQRAASDTHATAQPDPNCKAHVHDPRGLSTHLADAPAEHEGSIVHLALLPTVPRIGKGGRCAGAANAAPDEGRGGVLSQGAVQERRGASDGENGGRGTCMEEDLCEDLKGERGQRRAVCTHRVVIVSAESASLGGHVGQLLNLKCGVSEALGINTA
jgi:hypothetical protein